MFKSALCILYLPLLFITGRKRPGSGQKTAAEHRDLPRIPLYRGEQKRWTADDRGLLLVSIMGSARQLQVIWPGSSDRGSRG
jgi:hypothetical protein